MKTICGLLVGAFLLAGCNGMPTPFVNDQFEHHSMILSPVLGQATATQWNADYAVTAKHTPMLMGVQRECSSACDLVFIKRKAAGRLPVWRQFDPGEPVTAVGFAPMTMMLVKGEGVALTTRIEVAGFGKGVRYAAHDGPIVKGMSGGPVYAADGSILGITIGYLDKDAVYPKFADLEGSDRLSVYLPFDVIHGEWLKYRAEEMRTSAYTSRFKKSLNRLPPAAGHMQ